MEDVFLHIDDAVVPQLFTSALEAYEIEHKPSANSKKGNKQLETFGLLWGHQSLRLDGRPDCIHSTMCTVETSAIRHNDWVRPDFESIKAKKEFIEKYWPHMELVGTFHSHPYADLEEVNFHKGWNHSESDIGFWQQLHEEIAPQQHYLGHIVVTVTALAKKGWALPERLKGNADKSGYVITAENRKLWIKACLTDHFEEDGESYYGFNDGLELMIPSLTARFL